MGGPNDNAPLAIIICGAIAFAEDRRKQILAGGIIVWLILALNMLASHF